MNNLILAIICLIFLVALVLAGMAKRRSEMRVAQFYGRPWTPTEIRSVWIERSWCGINFTLQYDEFGDPLALYNADTGEEIEEPIADIVWDHFHDAFETDRENPR